MSITLEDATVIRRFKAGDRHAFERVVVEYRAELERHARRRVSDAATAEDLVQETFVRAFRAFDRLPDDSRVRPWLHQILANLCVDEANRCRREYDKAVRSAVESGFARTGPGPEHQLGLDTDDTALSAALAGLPDTYREAFEGRFVDELDYEQIAERAGVTETNVRARVSRARTALRTALQGAASVPLLFIVGLVRRPVRGPGGPTPGPGSAVGTTNAVQTATTVSSSASPLATSLAPAIDIANHVAVAAPTAVPLLTKAAVGIGAVAIAFTAAPEASVVPREAVAVEVPVAEPAVAVAAVAPLPLVAAPTSTPPTTAIASTTVVATTPPAAIVVESPVVSAPASTVAVLPVSATSDTTPTTVAPATTLAPETTTTTTTTVTVATPPPILGGTLQGSPSVSPSGPRLDVSGSVTLTVADASSGSISGRIGIDAPDPSGSRRIDGTLTVSVGSGTIDLRLAGHATTSEVLDDGVTPTSLSMSGLYRASGVTGQLATSGSFSGTLANGVLSLTLVP